MLNMKFPEVRRFHRAAVAHLDSARGLLERCPAATSSVRGHDVVYLSGYVVECSLKALLLTQYPLTKHEEWVLWFKMKLKHNLEMLRDELLKKRVNFSGAHLENLRRVRTTWGSEMRYEICAWNREESERVFLAGQALYRWASGD